MLQDGESIDLITSEDRKFEIGKVLRVKPIDNFTIEVSNFTPLDLENVTITAKINEIDHGKAFDIKPGKYRATITSYAHPMHDYDSCFTLISYQHIY